MALQIEITEKQFEQQVKDLAKTFQWKYYHTWRSIHSPAGFPDCVMVKPPRIIFAELKSEKGKVSPEQQEWLDILEKCAFEQPEPRFEPLSFDEPYKPMPEVYLWRPSQIDEIAEILR